MSRICIIGNSHLAALLQAHREGLYKSEHHEFDFWGVPGEKFKSMRYKDGALSLEDPAATRFAKSAWGEGKERLKISDYDQLVFCGGSITLYRLMNDIRIVLDKRKNFLSTGYMRAGIKAWMADQMTVKMIEEIKADMDIPVGLTPRPMTCEIDGMKTDYPAEGFEKINAEVMPVYIEACKKADIIPILQPKSTLVRGFHTDDKYSVGGARFDVEGKPGQVAKVEKRFRAHMNVDYGALILREIDQTLHA